MQQAVLEGLLFVVGDDGLTLEEIEKILDVTEEEAKALIGQLQTAYQEETRGIRIHFLGNRLKLATKPEHHTYYQKLLETDQSNTMSQAALETLAIIAYNQPLTRMQIDHLRGIASGQMIRRLVAKGFVKETGRSDMPGRPIIYETTSAFLDYFGLATLEDLPDMRNFLENQNTETEEEVDLYESKYQED